MNDVDQDDKPRRFQPRVEVEAWRITATNGEAVGAWCHGRWLTTLNAVDVDPGSYDDGARWLAYVGDWVIRGVNGDFWVLRDAEFQRSYLPVENQ
jgi:hypothetical protein